MYSKQTNLESAYSWNKMWSWKSLVMYVTTESKRVSLSLVYMKYNISDSQALFWCSFLIILEMVSLDTLLLYSTGQQAWICS